MLRSDPSVALDAVEIYAMGGDGTAVKTNKYHNSDPSAHKKSICIIDGDSKQKENEEERVFRLPGEAPELYIFDEMVDKLEESSSILAVRCMREYNDTKSVKETILSVSKTNRDSHLLFGQIGERIGFVDENIVQNAFLTTWCEKYKEEAQNMVNKIRQYLPIINAERDNT